MTDWISETFSDTTGWDHLETLVNAGHRMGGSESEREAAVATRDAFDAIGARNARLEEFDIQGWTRGSSDIAHPGTGTTHDCFALPRSPADAAEGRLVDLGYGLPEDFEGRDVEGAVVIAQSNVPDGYDRWVHRREKYGLAVEHGAAAFLFQNHLDGCLPRSGTIRGVDGDPIGVIPAIAVSYEVGRRLARRFEGDRLRVDVEADIHDATSQNVIADIGPDTDERLIVSAHVDGHDISESAGDDGVGVGTVVAVGRALAAREDELETRIQLTAFGAEELGLLGSGYHARTTDLDTITAVVQNDGVARARDLHAFTNGFDGFGEAVRRAAASLNCPVSVDDELFLSSDQWRFVERGVPGCLLTSEHPDGAPAFGSSNATVLTPADTLDKLDPRDLRDHAIIETEFVTGLAATDVEMEHRSVAAVERQVDAEGKAYKAGLYDPGDGPFR